MPTNINQNIQSRNKYFEACFKDAYGIKTKILESKILDEHGNIDKIIVRFEYKDSIYVLLEQYHSGNNNSTDYVLYELNGVEKNRFNTYYEAEIAIVEDMRNT
jgi:hypothetical protein